MRKRKYRGLTKDKDERWIYGWYSYNSKRNIHMITEDNSGTWEVIPKTVGQFTGLHKNGKEIYGEDKFRGKQSGTIYKVVFRDGEYSLVYDSKSPPIKDYRHCSLRYGLNNLGIEIIGDIHTTPDLMENRK